jgi:autotransporter-associated beta strand protein
MGTSATGSSVGFSTTAGTLTLNFGGAGSTVQWGSANFNPTNLCLGRGSGSNADTYNLVNGLDLNGAIRTIRLGTRATATISGNIVNTAGTASGLTVRGSSVGTLILNGTNTYNGTTTVTAAVLRANEGAGLSANTNLVLFGGVLENNGASTFNRTLGTGPGQVQVVGATSGFSAFGGTHTIQLNGGTGTVVWGSADFNPTSTLHLNGLVASFSNTNALLDFQNGIDLNAGTGAIRTISSRDNPNSTADVARISGVISNSAGAGILVFGGNGVIELTAANTYSGPTVLNDSNFLPNTTVKLVGTGSIAASTAIDIGTARTLDVTALTGGANYSASAGRFAVASGQTFGGTGTVNGAVLVGNGGTLRGGSPTTLLNAPTGQLIVNGSVRLANGGILAVDLNGQLSSGATVSRVAVTGAGNTFDISTTGGAPTINLQNTLGLVASQSYTYTIASSAGGFTRDGTAVTSYSFGTDFFLAGSLGTFENVSLTVTGSNLVLTFTPVPEPATVGLVATASLALLGVVRRWRRTSQSNLGSELVDGDTATNG